MPNLITLSIDVTRIDKARLTRSKMPGNDAKYMSLVLIPMRAPDEHGNDYIVKQGVTKEERQQGVDMPIIGKAKTWKPKGDSSAPTPQSKSTPQPAQFKSHVPGPGEDDPDDVPF